MAGRLLFISFMLAFSGARGQSIASKAGPTYQFVNGRWFDGLTFRAKTLYSVDGVLTTTKPVRVDSVLDLTGKYIVPPFGEAHNHNIDGFKKVDDRIQRYLADGIFYVKNPNSIPRHTKELHGKINVPSSVDVTFSNGGLTASGGHPLELVKRNIGLGIFTEQDAEGGMYYLVDNVAQLREKWGRILADGPDFIKAYLLYSEEYAKRRDDTTYFGWKGLDPAVLAEIVTMAHREGLRVSTHIETATDFHHAVRAGVDEINHMPGFRADSMTDFSIFAIAEDDARAAGLKHIFVVTTLAGGTDLSAAYQKRLDKLHIRNLRLLKKYHVPIAVGSDEYRQTSVREALYLQRLQVFSAAEMLRIWCVNTAAAIFPQRKIGRLAEGYEASFLVLGGDPTADFMNTQKIELRVKQGELIQVWR